MGTPSCFTEVGALTFIILMKCAPTPLSNGTKGSIPKSMPKKLSAQSTHPYLFSALSSHSNNFPQKIENPASTLFGPCFLFPFQYILNLEKRLCVRLWRGRVIKANAKIAQTLISNTKERKTYFCCVYLKYT